ncbi:MAG: tRNA (guanosine(37)-N1)-methyltransferase TrmD [Sphaerochaeta sp.]
MKITILTLFPEMVEGFFSNSIMKRAVERGLVEYQVVNWRQWATDRHQSCDDIPYGGGAGMVISCEPMFAALDAHDAKSKRVIYPSPSGRLFDQQWAKELSGEEELLFICGHYEGLDQRIIDEYVDDEISIGDYVISSGEVASLVIIDALYRHIEGVIKTDSLEEESFEGGLLEYPHYTRPETYCSKSVPTVLLSGHHAKIERWRLQKRLERSMERRPDLLERANLDADSRKIFNALRTQSAKGTVDDGRNESY